MKCKDCMWFGNDCKYAEGRGDMVAWNCLNMKSKNDKEEDEFKSDNPYQE